MKIAILGTGSVGRTIGSKMLSLGHEVKMGSRTTTNEKGSEWVKNAGGKASLGTFADAAAFGEIIFNCTKGEITIDALKLAGAENIKGKVLIDISNPLDFSNGFPPTLSICNTDSLGETIQREFPDVKVVKSLNTMNAAIMMDPGKLSGDHVVFVSGNDTDAKMLVRKILGEIGWKENNIIDTGDISTARGTEQLLPIWVRLYGAWGNADFNFNIVR